MADFKKALKEVFALEFSNPKNALHTNKGEVGYTFCGIYETANPNWKGWPLIKTIVKKHKTLSEASIECYNNAEIMKLAEDVYEDRYWSPYRLGELNQTAAEEIFVFGVNTGMATAIKKAQKVAGVVEDGQVGPATIKAINAINESVFDLKFDEEEIKHYNSLIAKKPSFAMFKNGWHSRAKAV